MKKSGNCHAMACVFLSKSLMPDPKKEVTE
jgi:hypothetical protein